MTIREREQGDEKSHRSAESHQIWKESTALLFIAFLCAVFVAYGLFMFLSVGDKGPPGWDFGAAEDIPGKSVYSTSSGNTAAPEEQHVAGQPSQAGPISVKSGGQ
jgi:hypothetical protein